MGEESGEYREIPWWVAVIGGVLIAVFLELSMEAYFGASPMTRLWGLLREGMQEEMVDAAAGLRAVYAKSVKKRREITQVVTVYGEDKGAAEGELILTHRGELVRIGADGKVVRLRGREGQRILVTDVGTWDGERQTLAGLEATYRQRRWILDASGMWPANPSGRFERGSEKDPIPGFKISPNDAAYKITRMVDESGPFVRVQATGASPYLVISGLDPLPSLEGVPVSVRAQIRGHGSGKAELILNDVITEGGKTRSYTAVKPPSGKWVTLIVRARNVVYPSGGDNFNVGLFGVAAGDWFDVRELSVFLGNLP